MFPKYLVSEQTLSNEFIIDMGCPFICTASSFSAIAVCSSRLSFAGLAQNVSFVWEGSSTSITTIYSGLVPEGDQH